MVLLQYGFVKKRHKVGGNGEHENKWMLWKESLEEGKIGKTKGDLGGC